MVLAKATLVRLATTDGLCEAEAHVPLGATSVVDLTSVRVVQLLHVPRNLMHCKVIVNVLDEHFRWGWFPVELLAIGSNESVH